MLYSDYKTYTDPDILDLLDELDLSDDEKKRISALEEEYRSLIKESREEMLRLRNGDEGPDYDFSYPYTTEEHLQVLKSIVEWEQAGSDAWKAENQRRIDLYDELQRERSNLLNQFRIERFNKLNGNEDAIIADAVSKTQGLIEARISEAQQFLDMGFSFRMEYLRVDGNNLYLDPQKTEEACRDILALHYDYFSDKPEGLARLTAAVHTAIETSPYVSERGTLWGEANSKRKQYRTRARAAGAGATLVDITSLAIPSLKGYEAALGFTGKTSFSSKAYLAAINPKFLTGLVYKDGALSLNGNILTEAQIKDIVTKEAPEEIDTPLLALYYSIILEVTQKEYESGKLDPSTFMNKQIKIPVQDLARAMGITSHLGAPDIERIITRTQSFHTLFGTMTSDNAASVPSRYAVMLFGEYDSDSNTISFASPYLARLATDAIKQSRNPEISYKFHNRSIKSSSVRAGKNVMAFENVKIITTGIMQTGEKRTYKIKASTLVERNTLLKNELLRDPTHKTRTLKRVFTKTWEMLREDTTIPDTHELPDPSNPIFIPTASTLNTLILTFPPKGKDN